MNIFFTSHEPELCARDLDDLRLNKMILETAQILSTVFRKNGSTHVALYASTHESHPCVLWAGASRTNADWLIRYLQALHNEWRWRRDDPFGLQHTHAAGAKVGLFRQQMRQHSLPDMGPTEPANCSRYPDLDLYHSYRLTLAEKWLEDKRPPTWQRRGRPQWYTGMGSRFR